MARCYGIDEVCVLFAIDVSTLRRWRSAAGLTTIINPSNRSERLYTESQVVRLAVLHRRFAYISSVAAESGHLDLSEMLVALELRVAELERRISGNVDTQGSGG
jgi:DNA-binding transcriptional MerR regulator